MVLLSPSALWSGAVQGDAAAPIISDVVLFGLLYVVLRSPSHLLCGAAFSLIRLLVFLKK